MNEEALNDAYALFSSKGYNGGIKEFKSLIGSNPDALKDSYTLFRSSGYNGDINQYSELLGLKKKYLRISLLQRSLWNLLRELVLWGQSKLSLKRK